MANEKELWGETTLDRVKEWLKVTPLSPENREKIVKYVNNNWSNYKDRQLKQTLYGLLIDVKCELDINTDDSMLEIFRYECLGDGDL